MEKEKHAGGRPKSLLPNQIRLYDTPAPNRRKDIVTYHQFFKNRFYCMFEKDGTVKFIKKRQYYEGRTIQLREKSDGSFVGAVTLEKIKGGIYTIIEENEHKVIIKADLI